MKYNLIWETEKPELTELQIYKLDREIVEIEQISDDPSSLVFHTVQLGDSFEDPVIIIYGKSENSDDLFLAYNEHTEWVNLEDLDAEDI